MDDIGNDIKQEFEDKIKNIKEHEKNKSMIMQVVLSTIVVMLFVLVSIGTIMSYNSYKKVKTNTKNVVEFKSMNMEAK